MNGAVAVGGLILISETCSVTGCVDITVSLSDGILPYVAEYFSTNVTCGEGIHAVLSMVFLRGSYPSLFAKTARGEVGN